MAHFDVLAAVAGRRQGRKPFESARVGEAPPGVADDRVGGGWCRRRLGSWQGGAVTVVAAMLALATTGSAAPGPVQLVSLSPDGVQLAGPSSIGDMSDDGRIVAFTNAGSAQGLHIRDTATGLTELIAGGTPSLSDDGRYVAYSSGADIFVRDRQEGVTTRASIDSGGDPVEGSEPMISGNGRYVVFTTGSAGQGSQVVLRDLQLGTTEQVSVQGNGDGLAPGGYAPSISDDGRYVAFVSGLRALLRDRAAGTTKVVSLNAVGDVVGASQVEISGDGSTVAFDDVSTRNGQAIAFLVVRRVAGGQLTEVAGDADGIGVGSLSDDGRLATFLGPYPAGLMSGSWSPRILETSSGVHEVAARNLSGDAIAPDSTERVIVSGSGSHVAFSSRAGDLIADDMTGGANGFDVFRVSLIDDTDAVARTVPAGGSVATGTSATAADPIETRVVTPVAGTIEITETDGGTAPTGYSLLGQQVDIVAPVASVSDPLELTFLLDSSLVPAAGADSVALFRDGVEAAPCAGNERVASPDPCIAQRRVLPDGDLIITVLSSHASTWTLARVAQPYVFTGFFQPVDNAPTVNTTRAGSAVPVAFSLGRNAGLGIFAANSPSSRAVNCSTTTPSDEIEQTVANPGNSALSYDPLTNRYLFVWRTDRAWAGTCRALTLKFKDGTVKTAQFRLR
ncbi:MAG TPA: PxKF domain-containing protein [Miltoncostaeaceae bacterium]|nr:PxKF domain-containing protein [Miltoncostaeaceae bacterium]